MFLAFLCVSDHFESIETHFFFWNFREREARNVRERNNREYEHEAQSAEGAKQPSSPAGLAWRGTKWLAGLVLYEISPFVTPPRNRGGVIFSLQFVCVSVCMPDTACEQNSSRTNAPIWTRFSLNGCLAHWLKPYWNWWPWVKDQGHSGSKSIVFFIILS